MDNNLDNAIKQAVRQSINEAKDRHREGYWKERWAKQKAEKEKQIAKGEPVENDRKEYWKKRWEKQKAEQQKQKVKAQKSKKHSDSNVSYEKQDTAQRVDYDVLDRPFTDAECDDVMMNSLHLPLFQREIDTKSKKHKKKKSKNRKEYYREYNKKHPERLNRGYTKGYINGNVNDGLDIPDNYVIGYDELGRPITNHPLSDMLRNKEMEWHDDDWCEDD